jgi:CO dehydrogenase/acetyl-CoA synthase beta subunit
MSVFDIYIKKISQYVEDMKAKNRRITVFDAPSTFIRLKEGLPFKVGPDANPGIILRQDTYVELGNPEAGSCAIMLSTDNTSLIRDGRITLIGPDIPESEGKSLPFGQVLIFGGVGLDDKEHESLQQHGFVSDSIEGYMIRSLPQNVWSRVSKDAAGKGFDFECLGKALMSVYKSCNQKIETMEIVFLTSGKDDVKLLDELSAQVQKISREIVKENWKIKGYDIDCEFDCSSCADKPVCDDIREVLKEKRRKKLLGTLNT